jgi:hypothetical protein
MAYTVADSELGFVDLYAVDTVGPGPLSLAQTTPTYGRFNRPGYEIRGVDSVLGGGSFMFVQAAGTIAAGDTVEITTTNVGTNARYDVSAKKWAGTANTGKPLGVAMVAATTGQWIWVQVQGIAVANTNGTIAADNPLSWQAAGVLSATIVAGKAILGAVASSANNATYGTGSGAVVLSGQSLVYLDRPCAQGPIT